MSSKHRLVSVRMVRRRLEQVQKRFSSAGIFAIIFIGTKSPKVIQEIVHGILPCEISYPHTKRNTSYRSLPIGQPRIIFRFTGPGCCFIFWILITEIHVHWCYSCVSLRLCFKYIKKFPCYDIISKGSWGSDVINLQPCNENEYFFATPLPFQGQQRSRAFVYFRLKLKLKRGVLSSTWSWDEKCG